MEDPTQIVVHKAIISVDDRSHPVTVPASPYFKVVAVGEQGRNDQVVMWYERPWPTDDEILTTHYYRVFGTGQPIPGGCYYIGTVNVPNSILVWHLYEVPQAVAQRA